MLDLTRKLEKLEVIPRLHRSNKNDIYIIAYKMLIISLMLKNGGLRRKGPGGSPFC